MSITFGDIKAWVASLFAGRPASPRRRADDLPDSDLAHPWDDREWLKKSKGVAALRIPIGRLKEDTGVVKWHMWRLGPPGPDGKPTRTEVLDHAILRLWQKPNPRMTGIQFRGLYQQWYDTVGKVPIRIEYQADGVTPLYLWPVVPHHVHEFPKADLLDPATGEPYWEITWRKKRKRLQVHELIYITDVDPEDPYGWGVGAAQACKDDVAQIVAMNVWANNFFRQGAHHGKIVGVPGLNETNRPGIQAAYTKDHVGLENSHKTFFVGTGGSGSVSVVEGGPAHKDLDFVNGQKFLGDRIRETLGVPPEVVGHVENSNRATAEAADYTHQSKNIKPRVEKMAAEFAPYWLIWFGDESLVLEPEEPVRQTTDQAHAAADSGWKSGAICRNEWRRRHSEDPLPDPLGSQFLVPANMTVMDQNGHVVQTTVEATLATQKGAAPPSEAVDTKSGRLQDVGAKVRPLRALEGGA